MGMVALAELGVVAAGGVEVVGSEEGEVRAVGPGAP